MRIGIVGWKGDPHLSPVPRRQLDPDRRRLLADRHGVEPSARRRSGGRLATDGPHERVGHPQYAGFIAIMVGFLLQWPTLPTLVMFPILVVALLGAAR